MSTASLPSSRNRESDARLLESAAVLIVVAAAALWSSHTQQFRVFRLWDSDEYYALAEQLATGAPVTASAPYVYRVLTPWLVARCCPENIQQGFLIVNIVAGALGALALAAWLRRFVPDWRVRLVVTSAYVWEWHAPVRFVYYYPAYVDPLLLLFLPLGLLFVERVAERPGALNVAALIAITGAGVLAREVMVLVPATALLHRGLWARVPVRMRPVVLGGPILAAVAATIVAHRGTEPRVAYSFLDAVLYHLRHKPLFSLVLTWFMTFGPVIAVVVYDWRAAAAFLRGHRHLAAYLVACAVLAYVGGHDTERYLIWAAPVVYILVGRAILHHRQALGGALLAVLVAAQMVSERVFWGIPDPTSSVAAFGEMPGMAARVASALNRLFVIDDFHWNLWSNFGSRPFHMLLLALYAAFSALVIVWMRSRSVGAPWTSKHVEI